jgi:hypothetical protein
VLRPKFLLVTIAVDDPAGRGLVASLARAWRKRHRTDVSAGDELRGKRVELLKELVPAATRVGILAAAPQPKQWNNCLSKSVDSEAVFSLWKSIERGRDGADQALRDRGGG